MFCFKGALKKEYIGTGEGFKDICRNFSIDATWRKVVFSYFIPWSSSGSTTPFSGLLRRCKLKLHHGFKLKSGQNNKVKSSLKGYPYKNIKKMIISNFRTN